MTRTVADLKGGEWVRLDLGCVRIGQRFDGTHRWARLLDAEMREGALVFLVPGTRVLEVLPPPERPVVSSEPVVRKRSTARSARPMGDG